MPKDFNPTDDSFFIDPYPTYRFFRETDPVHWSASLDGWFVFRHDDVMAVLKDPRFSSATYDSGHLKALGGGKLGPFGRDALTKLNRIDPPDHTRIRALVNKVFTPAAAEKLTGKVQNTANALVERVRDRGEMDLIASFASPLPLLTICDLLGLPRRDAKKLKSLSDAFVAALDISLSSDQLASADRAVTELAEYFGAYIERWRQSPGKNLLSDLVKLEEEGEKLSKEELFTLLRLLLNGGHETTTNAIGHCFLSLLASPDQCKYFVDLLGGERKKLEHAVNELQRYDTSVQIVVRRATKDAELRGKTIKKGQTVNVVLGSANRDPEVFQDPDRLDLQRDPEAQHLAFGHGIHFCLGAALARVELRVGLESLFRETAYHEVDVSRIVRPKTLKFRGLTSVPVRFAKRAASAGARKTTVSDYVLDSIAKEKVTHVFMVPGGSIDPFMAAFERSGVTPIVAAHEAGAGFMADGYGRAIGRFGACMAIGGPGAANMVPPLCAAHVDSTGILAIVGEVDTRAAGRGAFQDGSAAGLNDTAVVAPVTALAATVEHPGTIDLHMRRAMRAMLGSVHKPVYLKIPRDFQELMLEESVQPYVPLPDNYYNPPVVDLGSAHKAAALLERHKGVVVLAGRGVEKSDAGNELVRFAEEFSLPVATTLRGKGVFPESHKLSLGVFGYAGSPRAIQTILSDEVDVLIVLGSSLGQRDTMKWSPKFQPSKALVQVDVDPTMIGRNFPASHPIIGDVRETLKAWLRKKPSKPVRDLAAERAGWYHSLERRFTHFENPSEETSTRSGAIHPANVIKALAPVAGFYDAVALVDSGAHRVFAGHYWEKVDKPRRYLSATGLAPMGWAIPASIGAQLARPDVPCVAITGDGCMLMHGIEIQTAARYMVPAIVVVINNSALANVYLRTKDMPESAKALTRLPTHDWSRWADALGVAARRVTQDRDLRPAFEEAFAGWKKRKGPYLIDVICDPDVQPPTQAWKEAKPPYM